MKRSAFVLITILLLAGYAHAGTVNLRLGPEGEILGWLAVGPFQNPGTEKMTCRGFDTDCLFPSEAEARPVEGRTAPSTNAILTWRLALSGTKNGLDFVPLFGDRDPGVAYAYAELVSPSAMDARLLLGSDDGVKVWVNGVLVHTSHQTRGVERDKDRVDIHLDKGANRLLFKVDQHFGGWGLLVRITSPDGAPIAGLVERLDIRSDVSDRSDAAIVRRMSGKSGSLDLDSLMQFRELRRTIEMWMPWMRREVDKGLPIRRALQEWSGKVSAAQRGSADQLSDTLKQANWAWMRQYRAWEANRKTFESPDPWIEPDVRDKDYISLAPGGRYFVHPDGSFFIAIGYNHNPEWPQTGESAISRPWYNPAITDAYFAHMQDCGVNVLRMMIEAPGGGFILEKPIGTFQPEQIAFVDNIVSLARKHDVKLMITPWDTFWMNHTWDDNPYNVKNGGPVENKVDFLTKPEVIKAQKNRWKFIIDRWGNTGTIFAWELFNEIDLWWGASPEQIQAWVREMSDFVRTYEKRKWGRNHLLSVSIANPFPKDGLDVVAYTQPGIDIANTHLYIGAANAPDEPIGPVGAEREGVTYAMDRIKDNRPYIDTENGPINRWIADEKVDNEVFHNMSWAHLASGGAGSGFRWPYRGPHHLTEGMYQHLKRMSKFTKDVPWGKLTGNRSEIKVTVPEGWVSCQIATKQGALIWVTSANPSAGTIGISWPDTPKSVRYRCYDTKTGDWFARGSGASPIVLDGKHGSVAIVIE